MFLGILVAMIQGPADMLTGDFRRAIKIRVVVRMVFSHGFRHSIAIDEADEE